MIALEGDTIGALLHARAWADVWRTLAIQLANATRDALIGGHKGDANRYARRCLRARDRAHVAARRAAALVRTLGD